MKETVRLVQLDHAETGRHIALVQEPVLMIISGVTSVYELALLAIRNKATIPSVIKSRLSSSMIDYNAVYEKGGDWTLLPSFDHPTNPYACLVSGTGLTHKNSALNRQMMHEGGQDKLTDSMKIYQWGLEGGQPAPGTIGVQPEWFYKGHGDILKTHGDVLEIPAYGNDGGEEPEIAGVYVIDDAGIPYRIGFTTGNEFSDHVMEKKNYLYLAPSKLRSCAIGPELVVDANFLDISGTVKIERQNKPVWEQAIKTGEHNMAHSLANLEYHHFKYEQHRIPLQTHVHFFGADAFSFGKGIHLETGDVMSVQWNGFGRPLQNRLSVPAQKEKWIEVKSLA